MAGKRSGRPPGCEPVRRGIGSHGRWWDDGPSSDSAYPVTCALDAPLEQANLQPIFSYLLAIPHILLLGLYGIVAFVNAIVAWFSIITSGSPSESAR